MSAVPGLIGADDDRCSDQGWDCVEPATQDCWDLEHEDVTHHASADAGDRAQDDGFRGAEAVGQRGRCAGHAEEREAGGVEGFDRALESVDRGVREAGHETGGASYGQVAPVTKRGRRNSDQQVPDGPAGDADNHREHHRAKQIELLAHAGHAAAEAEHERPDQVEDEEQGRIEPVQQRRAAVGICAGYCASQAQLAVTSVSTPVSSVG